jgi:hypothetical protein
MDTFTATGKRRRSERLGNPVCDETPSPKLWLAEKISAKPERQKATKGDNELVAI